MTIVYMDDYRTYRETLTRIREALRLMQADDALYIKPARYGPNDIIGAVNDYVWSIKPPAPLARDDCAGWLINHYQCNVLLDELAMLNKHGCPKYQEAS